MYIYISSFYYCFVVLTTVGYGDIVSVNVYERIFTIIWMLFGIGFYSFTISFITFFFTSQDSRRTLFKKKMEEVLEFSKEKKLDKKLKDQIINNLEFASHSISYRWVSKNLKITKDIPLDLKFELIKEFHPILMTCPFFKTWDQTFSLRIIKFLRPQFVKKSEFIWKEGDSANFIVFIKKGYIFIKGENLLRKDNKEKEDAE